MDALAELNQILADDLGEPATCREELEQVGIDLDDAYGDEPWNLVALKATYGLLDVDARTATVVRGK